MGRASSPTPRSHENRLSPYHEQSIDQRAEGHPAIRDDRSPARSPRGGLPFRLGDVCDGCGVTERGKPAVRWCNLVREGRR
jgi:hypothetical protein